MSGDVKMFIEKWRDRLIKRIKWYDFSLIKASVFFFTLFLLTVWPDFRTFTLSINPYIYLILFIIVSIPVMKKMLSD